MTNRWLLKVVLIRLVIQRAWNNSWQEHPYSFAASCTVWGGALAANLVCVGWAIVLIILVALPTFYMLLYESRTRGEQFG
jgi:hypothetical protein